MTDHRARTAHDLDDTTVDVRLTIMEYADVAGGYAAAVSAPGVPRAVVDDYVVVVDVLALAHALPPADVPPVLAVGARALRRVHFALRGQPQPRETP